MATRWDLKFELFEEARAREPEERGRFLAEACGEDAALRAEVDALLAADAVDRGVFERPWPMLPLPRDQASDLAGQEIGPYRLIEKIGEGGMGVVYAAEQEAPLRRRVALKLVKPGLDTEELLARFNVERQTLALMAHPNIATVHDAGVTDGSRPYFVMELVEGLPLLDYCDADRLTVDERLELFLLICRAVHHAHGRGILHRDLKPSNILVTEKDGEPVPKVIDFGIAKTLAGDPAGVSAPTRRGELLGTPEYMSPEQVELRLDLDVRTDVYSLGVLLYQLLAGALPFDVERLRTGGLPEIRRVICDDPLPSLDRCLTGLGESLDAMARDRQTDPRTLRRQLRGELAWIVARAMARDREERYAGVDELAADLERHLDGEPVAAGPPSLLYRARKLAVRHRTPVLAAAAVLVALVAGLVATGLALREARHARGEAEQQAAIAEAVNRFLNEDLLARAAPDGPGDRERSVGEILEQAAATVEARFRDQPVVEASIRQTLGMTFGAIGRYKEGTPHLERAHALRLEHLGPEHEETLHSAGELAASYLAIGQFEQAEELLRPTVATAERVLDPDHEQTLEYLDLLGTLLSDRGDLEAAVDVEREVLERRLRSLGPEHRLVAKSMSELALDLGTLGRHDEAIELQERALPIMRREYGAQHPQTVSTLANLGATYSQAGRLEEAEPVLREALELQAQIRGPDHPRVLMDTTNLATVLYQLGRYDEARRLAARARDGLVAAQGEAHPAPLVAGKLIAQSLDAEGRSEEARAIYVELLATAREGLQGHPATGNILTHYGRCLLHLGRLEEARAALGEAYDILRATLGNDHRITQQAVEAGVELAERLEEPDELELWRSRLPSSDP